jgi:dienelactone hydrolase
MKSLISILLTLSGVLTAAARIHTELIEYKHGETVLEGYPAYDASMKGKRPGVLIVHQWKGLTEYEKKRVEMLARLGCNVFALDIYGKGIRPQSSQEAGVEAGKYKKNRDLLRARAQAGLAVLQKHEWTDPKRVAAIGYCFGGTG